MTSCRICSHFIRISFQFKTLRDIFVFVSGFLRFLTLHIISQNIIFLLFVSGRPKLTIFRTFTFQSFDNKLIRTLFSRIYKSTRINVCIHFERSRGRFGSIRNRLHLLWLRQLQSGLAFIRLHNQIARFSIFYFILQLVIHYDKL